MKQYNAKSKVPTILLWAIVILITIGMIVAIIVGATKTKNSEKPADNPSQSESTTENNESEKDPGTDIPAIPPETKPGDAESGEPVEDDPGDVHIDIEKPDGAPKPQEPFVEGEVVIIPGLKEVDENETGN